MLPEARSGGLARRGASLYLVLMGAVVGVLFTGLALPLMIGGKGEASLGGAPIVTGPSGQPSGITTEANGPAAGDQNGTAETVAPSVGGSNAPAGAPPRSGGGAATTLPSATALTATEEGVTATTIKLGFLIYSLGEAGRLGISAAGLDPAQQRAAYQAFVDETNATGGINGRRIEPVYRVYDVANSDDQRAACLDLTEDKKVFAVVGGFVDASVRPCVTQQHRVPLVTGDLVSDTQFDAAKGLLFTIFPRGNRMMDNLAADLHRGGLVARKRIGIVGDDQFDPGATTARRLAERLTKEGEQVVATFQFAADVGTSGSQVPLAVQKMRSSNADVVIMLVEGFVRGSSFAQTADSQAYRPQWVTSDWASDSVDNAWANAPRSFDGAIGITSSQSSIWRSVPERPVESACRRIYEQRSGRKGEPRDDPADLRYSVVMSECSMFRVVVAGARAAGVNLTRSRLSDAIQALGPVVSPSVGDGAYRPGKFDLSDSLRTHQWNATCKCFKPQAGWRRVTY